MSELIASEGGVLGTTRLKGEQEVELYFCNPDLLWGSDYSLARYGAGGESKIFLSFLTRLSLTSVQLFVSES